MRGAVNMSKRILALVLTVLMLFACLASCNKATLDPTETEPTKAPTETQKPTETKKPDTGNNTNNNNNNNETNKKPVIVDTNVDDSNLVIPDGPDIFKDGQIKLADTDVSQFTIVFPAEYTAAEQLIAYDLADWIEEITGTPIQVVADDVPATAHEILIGDTNRAESDEVTKNGFANNYTFYAKVANGKVAIAAGHSDGYYIAQHSFMKVVERCKGQLNCDFSNQSLSHDSLKKISTGAVQIDSTPTGLKYYKCTPAQEAYWAQAHSGAATNAKAANGCRLDFETNSSTLYFEVTAGNCVFLLNGKQIATSLKSKFYRLSTLEGYKEGTNRITIILPGSNNEGWRLSKVWLDSGAETKRHEYDLKMLFLGDSITQGYNNKGNEANTYTFYTSEYFNAESIVQGNGGAVFDPKYLVELDYEPDVIIVAYGCNDWSRYRNSDGNTIMQKIKAYFDKLVSLYPDTPIIALSPIYRYDLDDHNASIDFIYMHAYIDDVCYNYKNVTVINGMDFVPHREADRDILWADDIHPNGQGFIEYGKSLTAAIKTQIEAIIAAKSNS